MCRIIPRSGDVHKISTLGYTLGRHLFGMFQLGTNSSLAPPSQNSEKKKKEPKKWVSLRYAGSLAHKSGSQSGIEYADCQEFLCLRLFLTIFGHPLMVPWVN
jgi:hypothetical protein